MADERIIERIKKVLELSMNNPSVAEAQAAALKAQEMMAQYHVTMLDLDGVIKEPITEFEIEVGNKRWKYGLANVVARNYACKVFSRGSDYIIFYGYESDVLIAGNVFSMLFHVGTEGAKREVRRYRARGINTSGVYNCYTAGFVSGVSHELDKQCTALQIIVPTEVQQEFAEFSRAQGMTTRRITTTSRHDDELRQRGFTDGRSAMNARDLEAV